MNADIRISTDFLTHPKTQRTIRKYGPDAVIYLLTIWTFAAKHRSKGILSGLDEVDIAIAAGWPGDPQEFVDAFVKLGWLDKTPDGYVIHDWADHNGYAYHAEERTKKARMAAAARWGAKKENPGEQYYEHTPSNAGSNAKGNAPSPAPAPDPDPSPDPDPKDQNPFAGSREKIPPSPPPTKSEEMYFSQIDEFFRVLENGNLTEWKSAYPAVSLEDELLRARVWLKSNPKQRKKNLRRFVVNWLGRAQEKGGGGYGRGTPGRNEQSGGAGLREKYAGLGTSVKVG